MFLANQLEAASYKCCVLVQVGDQQSAMFSQCCFNVGDVKCTMGTGTFIDTNTGDSVHASIAGYVRIR